MREPKLRQAVIDEYKADKGPFGGATQTIDADAGNASGALVANGDGDGGAALALVENAPTAPFRGAGRPEPDHVPADPEIDSFGAFFVRLRFCSEFGWQNGSRPRGAPKCELSPPRSRFG